MRNVTFASSSSDRVCCCIGPVLTVTCMCNPAHRKSTISAQEEPLDPAIACRCYQHTARAPNIKRLCGPAGRGPFRLSPACTDDPGKNLHRTTCPHFSRRQRQGQARSCIISQQLRHAHVTACLGAAQACNVSPPTDGTSRVLPLCARRPILARALGPMHNSQHAEQRRRQHAMPDAHWAAATSLWPQYDTCGVSVHGHVVRHAALLRARERV